MSGGWRVRASAAALGLLAATRLATACDAAKPFVAVLFTGHPGEAFERAVLADLEAGLARSGVSVCQHSNAAQQRGISQLAELHVAAPSPQLVALRIRLRAGEKETRLDRQVELSQVPADSRAFAVALAADELLRSGGLEWLGGGAAEPALVPAAKAAPSASAVQPTADRAAAAPTAVSGSWSVGVRPALERFAGGQTLWGADAAVLLPLPARLELHMAAGLRRGVQVSAQQGQIESSALSLAAGARYQLIDARWQLAAGLGVQGARLSMQGVSPREGASASRFAGVALYAQGLLAASVPIAGPLRFELGTSLGVPLRELEATADGRTATAASGLQLGVASALWLQL